LSISRNPSGENTPPPRTFPSTRLNTSFSRDESKDHWSLCHLYPAGDVPGDPAGWPDWSDAVCWAPGPDVPLRAVPDAPSESDYPF
jgi:hypothetical protein